jgi:deoxyribonuclease-4
MNFGAHVSIATGLAQAPLNSKKIGGEVFQIFSRSPRGGKAPQINKKIIKEFNCALKNNLQKRFYIHAPYFINLASKDAKIVNATIQILQQELGRATLLGAMGVVTHLGSAKDIQRKAAIKQIIASIKKILSNYSGQSLLILENAAGSGNVIASQLEELAYIIKQLPLTIKNKVAVCLDTCHAFASGYNLSNAEQLNLFLREFEQLIGLKKLILIHANDSKGKLGSKKDRHEHIGAGFVGKQGFKTIVNHRLLKNIDCILETPNDKINAQKKDLQTIKSLVV